MTMTKIVCLVVVSVLASCSAVLAQEAIDPVSRAASISAFADGEQSVRFDRLYRVYENEVTQGGAPGSAARSSIVAGPRGPFAFSVEGRLDVATASTGRATALCSDSVLFAVHAGTPFSLSSAYAQDARTGAAAASGSVMVEVDGPGGITLRDGSVVAEVRLRSSDRPAGAAIGGTLAPGQYRLTVEFSANAAGVGAASTAGLSARALFTTSCRVDLTADGIVDLFDFLDFQTLFDDRDPRADFTEDGVFDLFDFLAFIDLFDGPC
jgi:hypothetical protein